MNTAAKHSATRLMVTFGVLSLAAILAGAAVIVRSQGASPAVAIRDLAAWVIGAAFAVGLSFGFRRGVTAALAWIAPLGLLATFVGPGLEGVHRWMSIGPLQANMAMLLLPLSVVAAAGSNRGWKAWLPLLAALPILAWQPDASQAAAVAAVLVFLAFGEARPLPRIGLITGAVAAAALAWVRPDPLAPEPQVEGVIHLAWDLAPLAAAGLLLLVLATAAAPGLATRGEPAARRAGVALALLLGVWSLAPFAGAFPVPFAGLTPSPILGAWLGVGLLAATLRCERRA